MELATSQAVSEITLIRHFRVVNRAPKLWLVSTIGTGHDLVFLPHFMTHYKSLGVNPSDMLLTLHNDPAKGPAGWQVAVQTQQLLQKMYGVRVVQLWNGTFETFRKYELQESLSRQYVLQQDWVMHPDVDELVFSRKRVMLIN